MKGKVWMCCSLCGISDTFIWTSVTHADLFPLWILKKWSEIRHIYLCHVRTDSNGVWPDTGLTSSNQIWRHIYDRQQYREFGCLALDHREMDVFWHFWTGTCVVKFTFDGRVGLGSAFQVKTGSDWNVPKWRYPNAFEVYNVWTADCGKLIFDMMVGSSALTQNAAD